MFTAALAYFDNYRQRRTKALRNEEAQRWFTDDVGALAELFNDPFSTDVENAALAKLYAQPAADALVLQAAQLQLDVVAGLRHDLRAQFAVTELHDAKTALDFDRHGACDHAAARWRFGVLKQIIAAKARGGKSV